MTKTRYGLLAGIAGAAVATWWFRFRNVTDLMPAHARGETIFRNTPQPTENDALGG